MSKLVLGTSGFIYPTNRKGQDLWKRLIKSELSEVLEFKSSGKGWDNNTHLYELDELPSFYRSLNIYLSTSVIEGAGMGVLEALSCGLSVVIPIGVGVYDELKSQYSVFRYQRGNYNSMIDAIQKCVDMIHNDEPDKQFLRNVTEQYTLTNWVNSHLEAFENLLYNTYDYRYNSSKTEIKGTPSDLNDNMGIYYVAYGEPARNCFKHALTSLRKYLAGIPVCLVSDTPVDIDLDYQFIEYPDNDIGARGNKTLIYELAPKEWSYVLYLDADTEVISSDVMLFFELLRDGFDVVFCTNPINYILVSDMNRPDNKEEMKELIEMLGTGELLQLNGGVFGFRRNETTQKIFNDWHTEWNKYGKRDQAALDRVLYNNQVRIYTLGVEWNTVTRYLPPERSAGILHYPLTARRWQGRIEGRLDGNEAWAVVHPEKVDK